MIQEAAGSTVRCMDRTNEPPCIRLELTSLSGPEFLEEGTAMDRAEMSQITEPIQVLNDNGEPLRLGEPLARIQRYVPSGYESLKISIKLATAHEDLSQLG